MGWPYKRGTIVCMNQNEMSLSFMLYFQPFCDGSHKKYWNEPRTLAQQGKFHPHRFQVTETKKYWLCMCKQTNNRPFCDGSHLAEEVQQKIRS